MPLDEFIVFKGKSSQTGKATEARFPGVLIEESSDTFDQIESKIKTGNVLAVLPIWNSHEGEIPKTNVLNMAFSDGVKIQELWCKSIVFAAVSRKAKEKIKKIISVFVAKNQCSHFIGQLDAEFVQSNSTVDAYNTFENDENIDAVLCVHGQYDIKKYMLLNENASNILNFTTFVLLGNVHYSKWDAPRWDALIQGALPKKLKLYGIEMSIPGITLREDQNELLDTISDNTKHLDQIPKIIFISKRGSGRCGMILESDQTYDFDLSLNEEGYEPNIIIKDDIGETSKYYNETIYNLIESEYPDILNHDFFKHVGANTCFYACPTLNIITHGFDEGIVEHVVRKIISNYFELMDNGIQRTDEQDKLFDKYKSAYREDSLDFIDFVAV